MEDPTIVAAFRQQWGLDKPLPEQYLSYLRNLVQGNLGVSIRTHMPVAEDLGRYLPASAELAVMATGVGIVLGIPFGVVSAVSVVALAATSVLMLPALLLAGRR